MTTMAMTPSSTRIEDVGRLSFSFVPDCSSTGKIQAFKFGLPWLTSVPSPVLTINFVH